MRLTYKKLGNYIQQVDVRNIDNIQTNLLGVSVSKEFIPSIANTTGTDWTKYKRIKKGQFCYIPDTSRRGDKIGVALLDDLNEALVSQAYTVFEISKPELLLGEYLILWFKRPEFDRYARYMSHGSVREIFDWEDMSNVKLPVPPIEIQEKIIRTANHFRKNIERSFEISKTITEILTNNFLESFAEISLELKEDKGFFKPVKIKDLVDVKNGFAFKSDAYSDDGIYGVVTIGNVQEDLLEVDSIKKVVKIPKRMPVHCKLSEGELLMSLTGNIGRTAFVIGENFLLNQRVCKIIPKEEHNMAFVFSLLNTKMMRNKLESISSGTAQQNLSTVAFEELSIYNLDLSKVTEFHKNFRMLNYKFYSLKNYYIQKELGAIIIPELLTKEEQ